MKKIIPNLFFLFLTSPILSPFIGGVTIYLSAVIIFFDVLFFKWVQQNLTKRQINEFILLFLLMLLASRNPALIVKMVMLLSSATYAYYCYITNKFFLYRWIVFNVLVALAQFILVFVNINTAVLIGPTNISTAIWGKFASPTNTNFYAISILPRVSGLSREGGFFAALLGVAFFVLLYDKQIAKNKKGKYYAFILLGLLMSLSKSTIILLLVPLIVYFKKYINILGAFSITVIYSLALTIICVYVYQNTDFFSNSDNITYTHRFSGYIFAPFVEIKNFISGVRLTDLLLKVDHLPFEIKANLTEGNLEFCGVPYLYLNYGIFVFFVFILFLKVLKINAACVVLIYVLTTNVSPLTCDGFVVLSWLLAYMLSHNIKEVVTGNDAFFALAKSNTFN